MEDITVHNLSERGLAGYMELILDKKKERTKAKKSYMVGASKISPAIYLDDENTPCYYLVQLGGGLLAGENYKNHIELEERTGSLEELEERGIIPFISSGLLSEATIESVYQDFILLGKIFQVENRATKVVEKMKGEVDRVLEKSKNIPQDKKVKVLIYDSGDSEAFVGGSGLPSNLIELAGGINIFEDLGQDYGLVSYESIVEKNPDIILVTEYYSGISGDEKIKILKQHAGVEDINAIKNNRIYKIGLIELAPGIRNSKTVEKMYEMFYEK